MAACYFSPIGNDQTVDSNGNPLVGGYWSAFLAGTSTPVTTYTDNAGTVPQPTDITLDASGRAANPIWLSGGIPVKFRLYSAAGVVLLTVDNVSGVNDPAGVTAQDQWVLYGAAPTYISATSFSVAGDQTGIFQIGRRIKSTNTGGIRYSSITNSVYGAVTTVTVTNDSGTLDSGMSAVSYGLISATSTSVPTTIARSGANTDITSLSTVTTTTQATTDISTKLATTAYAQSVSAKIQPITAAANTGAMTFTLNPTVLDFRASPITSGTVNSRSVAAAISVVVPSGATLGAITTVQARIAVVAIDNAGTVELAVINLSGGVNLDESALISTVAVTAGATAANVFYSTTLRSNVTFRVVGYVDAVNTAGAWASPVQIQGAGGEALAMASLGYGQTWQSVTRNNGTTYYNSTGKPIVLVLTSVSNTAANSYPTITVTQNGVSVIAGAGSAVAATNNSTATAIIPPGASYSWTISGGSTGNTAVELR